MSNLKGKDIFVPRNLESRFDDLKKVYIQKGYKPEEIFLEKDLEHIEQLKDVKIFIGNLDLSSLLLHKLPFDLHEVTGTFSCSSNRLKSLIGSPKKVGETFNCAYNDLTYLNGGPEWVGEDYICSFNNLKNLLGISKYVGGGVYCTENPRLNSLDGLIKFGTEINYDNPMGTIEYPKDKIINENMNKKNKLSLLETFDSIMKEADLAGIASGLSDLETTVGLTLEPTDCKPYDGNTLDVGDTLSVDCVVLEINLQPFPKATERQKFNFKYNADEKDEFDFMESKASFKGAVIGYNTGMISGSYPNLIPQMKKNQTPTFKVTGGDVSNSSIGAIKNGSIIKIKVLDVKVCR